MKHLTTLLFLSSVLLFSACNRETTPVQIKNTFGIVNVSVAGLYAEPRYGAELTTQLLLGAPMRLLQREGSWYQVKTTEEYVAWIPGNLFVKMDENQYEQYQNEPKIIFTDDYGAAYKTPSASRERVSDLVFGCILKLEADSAGYDKVSYPDGRTAYIASKQTDKLDHWISTRSANGDSIVQTAMTLKGIPYVWGGTSVKGMDCSGFSKTVFMKHGIILLRDASQQATTGIPVDISTGYENLQPGDLMFFGKKAAETKDKKERIRHVAIYIGNKEFIQALGYIQVSSLDPESSCYDEDNTREFVRASRITGAVGEQGIKSMNDYYVIN